MDTNGDGVLDFGEFQSGFRKFLGDREDVADLQTIFARLDLNCSGSIDYSEFCGAGIGKHMNEEEETLWATFKDFDANHKVKQELWTVASMTQDESNLEAWLCHMRQESSEKRLHAKKVLIEPPQSE